MDIAKIRKKAQKKSEEKDQKKSEEKAQESIPEEKPLHEPGEEEERETDEKELREAKEQEPAISVNAAGETAETEDKEKPADIEEADESSEQSLLELLTFSLSSEELAFKVSEVEEIIGLQRMTKVPSMPDYMCGITSLRGKIIPIIDLKRRLGLKMSAARKELENAEDADVQGPSTDEKIVIVAGPKGFIGAVIDKVMGVIRLHGSEVLEPPSHLTEAELRFIEGVVVYEKRFISIIRTDETMNIEVS
jgi:purine-binding chemotaxis protein CheW